MGCSALGAATSVALGLGLAGASSAEAGGGHPERGACWDLYGSMADHMQALCCYPRLKQNAPALPVNDCFDDGFRSQRCCRYLPPAGSPARSHPCLSSCTEEDLHSLSLNGTARYSGTCAYRELVSRYRRLQKTSMSARYASQMRRGLVSLQSALALCEGVDDDAAWTAGHVTVPIVRFGISTMFRFLQPRWPRGQARPGGGGRLALEVGAAGGVTTRYLLDHGWRVVAVEPNPVAVAVLRRRFARELELGALRLVPAAVRSPQQPSTVRFYSRTFNPQVSSTNSELEQFEDAVAVDVRAVTCAQLVRNLTEPLDAAIIDAEGSDLACLLDLCRGGGGRRRPAPPRYLSLELDDDGGTEAMSRLVAAGYTDFKLVDQSRFHLAVPEAGGAHDGLFGLPHVSSRGGLLRSEGGAGPPGEDALDLVSGPRWRSAEAVGLSIAGVLGTAFKGMLRELVQRRDANGELWREWFDLHARRGGPSPPV